MDPEKNVSTRKWNSGKIEGEILLRGTTPPPKKVFVPCVRSPTGVNFFLHASKGDLTFLFVIFSYLAARSAAAGAQRLLRAPKARALRAERRRREDVRSPAGVNYFIERAKRAKTEANGPSAARVVCAHP